MIKQVLRGSSDSFDIQAESEIMKDNKFFRKFTAQYSTQLHTIMQKNFGKKLNEKLSVNDELFYKKIMSYVND